MTLFILPSPNVSAAVVLPHRPPADATPEAATIAWAAHVERGRIGVAAPPPAPPPPAPQPGAELRCAALAAILGLPRDGARP